MAGRRVYPRACGGTPGPWKQHPVDEGLSPRMRGNRFFKPMPEITGGSIPAHAGEPGSYGSSEAPPRVYPRACGGTLVSWLRSEQLACYVPEGLSPRMRGNPVRSGRGRQYHGSIPAHAGDRGQVHGGAAVEGSIPAHAGEPLKHWTGYLAVGVYPRACGGTPCS